MLIDSHCHLFDPRYKKTVSEIVDECKESGVTGLLNICTNISSCTNNLKGIAEFESVWSSIGIYPHEDIGEKLDVLADKLRNFLKTDSKKKIVGIGECGIDIGSWENQRSLDEQIKLFELQINLALEFNLPVIVHNRNGDEQILNILNSYKNSLLRGVIHGTPSNRTWEISKKFLDLGYFLSFGGNTTYPSNHALREVLKKTPDDMFLLETDSPYLPPQGHRGEINHPKYVRIVAEKASQIKEKPFDEVCRLSFDNTCGLFKI